MFTNKYPYTDFHELNLDYVLKEIERFRAEIDNISVDIYDKIMDMIQPQLDDIINQFNDLSVQFNLFKNEVNNSLLSFEAQVTGQISDLERRFQEVQDQLNVQIEQVRMYSDVKDEELYNKIAADIADGVIAVGQGNVINYITGEVMTTQEMFDYLCTFHLSNPISYTQLALRAVTYNDMIALNITYTDVIVNGNLLIH